MKRVWAALWLTIPAAGQQLPERFPISDPVPAISKPVQPAKFIESVGRRGALLGREDGTFEAWINPVKVLRDFRLAVFFDGALEPVPLADLAERVTVGPGRVTITHSHAAFTIRQTWLAPMDRPALIVLLDIDTSRPLRLRAAFLPEMHPMWPASFGGQSSTWSDEDHALILGEGLRQHAAVVGSPLFTRHSEQVGHQLPDRTVLLEMDVAPAVARRYLIPIVIAASGHGAAEARKIYRETLAELRRALEESDAYYWAFEARTMRVTTPEATLNDAFRWARFALDKGWTCNEGVGCGLVAGYGPSGASERPGFAWYFGGDALMNLWSIVDYGDFDRARAALRFLRDHQRADGKMMHELTQSAALLDWSKYPYGYYHGDTTPLYLFSAARYVVRSGDIDFARQSWDSLARAYRYCSGVTDADGLLSNRKAGAGAVETGALSGKVDKDVYLEGAWLAGLEGYARLAELTGHPGQAADARERYRKARAALEAWFVPGKGFLAFARLTDGSTYQALSSWQAMALAYGGLDAKIADAATRTLARPELSTDWGTRLFAADSPFYDPLSYNDGSVWPFVTAFAMMAEFRNHQPHAGLRHLYGVAAMTGLSGAGFLTEYLSGERAQALPRAVPHQLFSSAAVVHPLVSGLLGLDGDGVAGRLTFSPHLPLGWAKTTFAGFRVGPSTVSGEVSREQGGVRIRLRVSGEALSINLAPAFPAGTKLLNQEEIRAQALPRGGDVHFAVDAGRRQSVDVLFRIEPGPEPSLDLVNPQPGDAPRRW